MNWKQLDEELDEENAQWEGFLQAWLDLFSTAWVRIADLIAAMDSSAGRDPAGSSSDPLAGALCEALPDALQMVRREQQATFKIRLGKALEKRVDTCFGRANLHLERGRDEHSKVCLWRVVAGGAGSPSIAPLRRKIPGAADR